MTQPSLIPDAEFDMWLANLQPVRQPFEFGQILVPALWLIGGILLAALAIVLAKKWGQSTPASDPVNEQLMHFRELYQRGDMSKEEYQRVHALLACRLREQNDLNPPEQTDGPVPPSGQK